MISSIGAFKYLSSEFPALILGVPNSNAYAFLFVKGMWFTSNAHD